MYKERNAENIRIYKSIVIEFFSYKKKDKIGTCIQRFNIGKCNCQQGI